MKKSGLIACLLMLLVTACTSPNPSQPPDPITVQLKWKHQAQFAGFYAAEQNGFYADENLDITFIPAGPNYDPHESVRSGDAQFGVTSGGNILFQRAKGDPFKAIAVIYRQNPRVYITLKESGIKRPADFANKTVNIPDPSMIAFSAMLEHQHIDPEENNITIINKVDMDAFYRGEVDVTAAYLTNEVLYAEEHGIDLNIIYPDDYGVHFYADTIYTTDDFLSENPELTERFLRATLKGWEWAVEHPHEVAALIPNYNPEADLAHEEAHFIASVPLVLEGGDAIGWMSHAEWQSMKELMEKYDPTYANIQAEEAYTMKVLEAIYREQP